MFTKIIFLVLVFFSFGNPSDENRSYHKEYYHKGEIKAQGWLKNGLKEGYWKFYHPNGILSEKGHYKEGKRQAYWYFYTETGIPKQAGHYEQGNMANWWLFFDSQGRINHKCQLNNGKKNGYCLQFRNEKLTSAEKYQNGRKIKKWTSFSSFKRENRLSDLK